jgi:hypothetical protein
VKAAGIHLVLSGLVVGALAASMWFGWYRSPYFRLDGGWHVLRILVLVDVVLGPLLTLIVFNRAKPELARDLTIIVLLQVSAFAYGAATLYLHRPVFTAAAQGNLYCVNWRDLDKAGGDQAGAVRLAQGASAPVFVHVALPTDAAERAAMWKAAGAGGPLPIHQAARFEAMTTQHWDALLRPETRVEELAKNDAGVAAELARVRSAHASLPFARLAFVPMSCRYGLVLAVFDRETRAMIDWMD